MKYLLLLLLVSCSGYGTDPGEETLTETCSVFNGSQGIYFCGFDDKDHCIETSREMSSQNYDNFICFEIKIVTEDN